MYTPQKVQTLTEGDETAALPRVACTPDPNVPEWMGSPGISSCNATPIPMMDAHTPVGLSDSTTMHSASKSKGRIADFDGEGITLFSSGDELEMNNGPSYQTEGSQHMFQHPTQDDNAGGDAFSPAGLTRKENNWEKNRAAVEDYWEQGGMSSDSDCYEDNEEEEDEEEAALVAALGGGRASPGGTVRCEVTCKTGRRLHSPNSSKSNTPQKSRARPPRPWHCASPVSGGSTQGTPAKPPTHRGSVGSAANTSTTQRRTSTPTSTNRLRNRSCSPTTPRRRAGSFNSDGGRYKRKTTQSDVEAGILSQQVQVLKKELAINKKQSIAEKKQQGQKLSSMCREQIKMNRAHQRMKHSVEIARRKEMNLQHIVQKKNHQVGTLKQTVKRSSKDRENVEKCLTKTNTDLQRATRAKKAAESRLQHQLHCKCNENQQLKDEVSRTRREVVQLTRCLYRMSKVVSTKGGDGVASLLGTRCSTPTNQTPTMAICLTSSSPTTTPRGRSCSTSSARRTMTPPASGHSRHIHTQDAACCGTHQSRHSCDSLQHEHHHQWPCHCGHTHGGGTVSSTEGGSTINSASATMCSGGTMSSGGYTSDGSQKYHPHGHPPLPPHPHVHQHHHDCAHHHHHHHTPDVYCHLHSPQHSIRSASPTIVDYRSPSPVGRQTPPPHPGCCVFGSPPVAGRCSPMHSFPQARDYQHHSVPMHPQQHYHHNCGHHNQGHTTDTQSHPQALRPQQHGDENVEGVPAIIPRCNPARDNAATPLYTPMVPVTEQ
eukprot:TRINITY_DN56169_c0_g1_i1.p1 TRINITY_DN56169_c0_g1~~TRINITY_DN56169_c0_g1_i1.p1  ORF type:complete len:808 (-),score=82.73 TRINITY_DN56169_c0_g1_i1:176-2482(-)